MKEQNKNMYDAVGQMLEMMPLILEMAKEKSKYNKARYQSLIDEGFTEQQALEIVKNEKTPFDN